MISKGEFAHIYEEFFPRIYGYLFHRVNDPVIAEDLVSQVFFKALGNLRKYDSQKGQISTWLYTIASNTLIDYYRQNDTTETIDESHEETIATEDDLSQEIDFETDIQMIMVALQKLPERTRQIITLRIFEELSFVEIARIIGIGESGAKMSFARGIEIIKNSMNLFVILISFLFN